MIFSPQSLKYPCKVFVFALLLFSLSNTYSQCIFTTNDNNKTLQEVENCLNSCSCNSIEVAAAITVSENWNLVGQGQLSVTVKNGGELIFAGSGQSIGEINLSSGSKIFIEDTNDPGALQAKNQGQVRITIGSEEYKGNEFEAIIAAGGADENGPFPTLLPVVLMSFEVKVYYGILKLSWQTTTELNNDYFTIERSNDGTTFSAIAAVQGFGTTNEPQEYEFTDEDPIPGLSYYRLKQTDFDGTTETFRPVSVVFREESYQASLFPNPLKNRELNIDLTDLSFKSDVKLSIFDISGYAVFESVITSGDLHKVSKFDVGFLPKGAYVVNLSGDGIQQYLKLVRE